ncbi:restriction endonuclease [Chloracidobacterium sp. MS 40/45]|uniref:BsuBI/PstI family type II restriction endonuclease n=1 Tax=Chloracidobacterium aggregatum TaxID=2851959 RepID=UPI001B8AC592|nr:BsuBI/PstI family type II restriction endonuclease [Chloracidobacterium aggregatum]QUW01715.1 restriction endonuclease [Chloracidobacterium sp. MS 40/45]
MADRAETQAADRVSEALDILRALDVPQKQQNKRSALTLLALLGLTPQKDWIQAANPCLGINEMMKHFGKKYAPNTRETVRRFTVHQFVQTGLVLANPDNPARPVNSPDTCYQVTPALLEIVRAYGTASWNESLRNFVNSAEALRRLQPGERAIPLIPVRLPDGRQLDLTAGGQNRLVKKIVEEFCPRFTPGGVLVYVGDTGRKQRHLETDYLTKLGVVFDEHGKMPDVIVHLPEKHWLVLIEAVTSHGPINVKRQNELRGLFKGATAGLVFVTAFLTRRAMARYLSEIAWETEVWVAEAPSHIIHFNGERFLGPYE